MSWLGHNQTENTFLSAIAGEFRDLYKFRWVTYAFVSSTLKMRYKRSVLGIFWSMLGPAANYLVMGMVFSVLMRDSMPNYFVYMFTGAALFNFISASINAGPLVLVGNENYIKKVYLPKSIFVLNHILMELVNFAFSILALFILGFSFGKLTFSISWVLVPLAIILAFFFLFGLVSLVSIAAVYFRDIVHILPIVMQAAFFGTPVLYALDSVPAQFHFLIRLNPFYYFVDVFRVPIFSGEWPSMNHFLIVLALSLITFFVGIFALKIFDNKIVFKL